MVVVQWCAGDEGVDAVWGHSITAMKCGPINVNLGLIY